MPRLAAKTLSKCGIWRIREAKSAATLAAGNAAGAAADASAGAGDALSWGTTRWLRDRLGMDWVDTCGTAYKLGGWAVVIGELIAGVGGKKAFKEGLEQGRDRLFRSGVREGGDEARERAARKAAEAAAERRAKSKPPK